MLQYSTGLDVSETHALVFSDTAAELYDITGAPKLAFSFTKASKAAPVLFGHCLSRAQGQFVEVCSMTGGVLQRLEVAEVCPI